MRMPLPGISDRTWDNLGVLFGFLACTVLQTAREIAERGTFTGLGRAVPSAEVNGSLIAWDA